MRRLGTLIITCLILASIILSPLSITPKASATPSPEDAYTLSGTFWYGAHYKFENGTFVQLDNYTIASFDFEDGTSQGWTAAQPDGYTCDIVSVTGYGYVLHVLEETAGFGVRAGWYIDIQNISLTKVVVELDWRAASGSSASAITNMHVTLFGGKQADMTDDTVPYAYYQWDGVAGGTTDTGWRHSKVVVPAGRWFRVFLNLGDAWSADNDQENWYDNIRIYPAGVVIQVPIGSWAELYDESGKLVAVSGDWDADGFLFLELPSETFNGTIKLHPPIQAWYFDDWLKRRVITVQDQASQRDLVGYAVNFTVPWEEGMKSDFSDLRFTYLSPDGEVEVPYWIEEKHDGENATVWVLVPKIPKGGSATLYMYFDNPLASRPFWNASHVFEFYWNFTTTSGWEYKETNAGFDWGLDTSNYVSPPSSLKVFLPSSTATSAGDKAMAYRLGIALPHNTTHVLEFWIRDSRGTTASAGYHIKKVILGGHTRYDGLEIYSKDVASDGTDWERVAYTTDMSGLAFKVEIYEDAAVTDYSITVWVDDIIVRPYVDPPPLVSIGSLEKKKVIELPSKSVAAVYNYIVSPNATTATLSFSATNSSTAGYTADGWFFSVYADPYQSAGTAYENTASLILELNATLPIDSILDNVTLTAVRLGTGKSYSLWVKLQNSTGVVYENTNETVTTTPSDIVIDIDAKQSGWLYLWINMTVVSTTTDREELNVSDIRIYLYGNLTLTKPTIERFLPNVASYNVTSKAYLTQYTLALNSTWLVVKVVQNLTLSSIDLDGTSLSYTTLGQETIGTDVYNLYRVDLPITNGTLTITSKLDNYIKSVTIKFAKTGVSTTTALLYEEVVIEAVHEGNITVKTPTGESVNFTDVSSVTFKPRSTGEYSIEARRVEPSEYKVGYATTRLTVSLGRASLNLKDKEGRVLSYIPVTLRVVNETSGATYTEESGVAKFTFDLPAGTFRFCVYYQGMLLGSASLELNSTTTGSVLELQVNAVEEIESYVSRWTVKPGSAVTGAVSINLTRIDPYNVEDEFTDFSIRYSWNDIYFNFGGTLLPVVNGTAITEYTERIMVLYPAQWGYVVLFWKQEGMVAITVSHAWGENIVITAINGTFAVSKSILDYLPLHWAVESDGVETDTSWVIPPGKHVHIWNTRYTKGEVEGLCFSNIPPYGHVEGMTVLLNLTETDAGQVYYVGTGIGADRVFYTTRDYLTITAFKDDWDKEAFVYAVLGFHTRYKRRYYMGGEPSADVKQIFALRGVNRLMGSYFDDPNTNTYLAPMEVRSLAIYEREGWYGMAMYLETYTTVPKEKKYDAWVFMEFKVEDEASKTLNITLGFVMRPVADITNYQQSGDTQAFSPYVHYGRTDIDFTVKEKYNGAWSTLADGNPYNYQDGYWAVYGEKTIGGTTYKTIVWLDRVFLGDKSSLTPQAVALYGYRIGLMVKEFDGTLHAGVEYGWVARFLVSTADVKRDVPSPQSSTDTDVVKGKLSLGVDYPRIVYKPRIIVSDRPFSLVDLLPKLPMSRITLETEPGARLILNYSSHPPTSFIIEGGKLLSYSGGIAVIEAEADKVNVTDVYRVSLLVKDRLGNLLSDFTIYINSTAYETQAGRVEDLLPVEDYVLKLPDQYGFKFYAFTDGYNESSRLISLWRDYSFTVEYRVPTSPSVEVKRIGGSPLSWLLALLQQVPEETVEAYVTGVLKDYYGNGVPSSPVVVNITNLETGYTLTLSVTTDVSGFFKTDVVELARGVDYEVKVYYAGDDTYVESMMVKQVSIAAPPLPVEVVGIPTEYIIAIVIAVIIGIAAALYAWRAARHVIEEEFERRRKFVRRKA